MAPLQPDVGLPDHGKIDTLPYRQWKRLAGSGFWPGYFLVDSCPIRERWPWKFREPDFRSPASVSVKLIEEVIDAFPRALCDPGVDAQDDRGDTR